MPSWSYSSALLALRRIRGRTAAAGWVTVGGSRSGAGPSSTGSWSAGVAGPSQTTVPVPLPFGLPFQRFLAESVPVSDSAGSHHVQIVEPRVGRPIVGALQVHLQGEVGEALLFGPHVHDDEPMAAVGLRVVRVSGP